MSEFQLKVFEPLFKHRGSVFIQKVDVGTSMLKKPNVMLSSQQDPPL